MSRNLLLTLTFALAPTACTPLRSGADTLGVNRDASVDAGVDEAGLRDARDTPADSGLDADRGLDSGRDVELDAHEAASPAVAELTSWFFHVCARLFDGGVECWGEDQQTALINPNVCSTALPAALVHTIDGGPLLDVAQVATGLSHTCVRTIGGRVLCWGEQYVGETGTLLGQPQPAPDPSRALPQSYAFVAAKGWVGAGTEPYGGQTCGVDTQQNVWCWGSNARGALGHDPGSHGDIAEMTTNANFYGNPTPVQVAGLSGITQVSLQDGGGCALTTGHRVLCWGWNQYGQLANGTTSDSATPSPIEITQGVALEDVARIYGGHDKVCALQSSGRLWCWGRNSDFAFGIGADAGNPVMPPTEYAGGGLEPIADAAIGQRHICVIRAFDQSVWCSGYNAEFELGIGSGGGEIDSGCPACVGVPVQVVGPNGNGFLAGALSLTAGFAATCARTTAGVYCWGDNDCGQTGHPPDTQGDDNSFSGHYSTTTPMLVQGLPR